MSTLDKIREIIAEQAMLEPGDIDVSASLEEVGVDSLGLVEGIFAIEETFDIQVPFNANAPEESDFDISSVRAIAAAVDKLIAEKAAS